MKTLTFGKLLKCARFCKSIGMTPIDRHLYLEGLLAGARFWYADRITLKLSSDKILVI